MELNTVYLSLDELTLLDSVLSEKEDFLKNKSVGLSKDSVELALAEVSKLREKIENELRKVDMKNRMKARAETKGKRTLF